MSNQFAKNFDTSHGQVVVMLHETEDGEPAIVHFMQPEGYGVCKMASGFSDDDEGFAKSEAAFEKVDQAYAEEFAQKFAAMAAGR